MGKIYDNKIIVTTGFNYPSNRPLDDREVVQSYGDLKDLYAYEGIEVYVVDDKKSYKLINSVWTAIATEEYVEDRIGGYLIDKEGNEVTTVVGMIDLVNIKVLEEASERRMED